MKSFTIFAIILPVTLFFGPLNVRQTLQKSIRLWSNLRMPFPAYTGCPYREAFDRSTGAVVHRFKKSPSAIRAGSDQAMASLNAAIGFSRKEAGTLPSLLALTVIAALGERRLYRGGNHQ